MPAKSLSNPVILAETTRRILTLRVDSPRRWGRMSAHQAICHVADALRMALGDAPAPPRTDTWLMRHLVRRIALYAPIPAPRGVKTVEGFDQVAGQGTPPGDFVADRDELVVLHERFASNGGRVAIHPLFGPLSKEEWMIWAYRHANHHFHQFGV